MRPTVIHGADLDVALLALRTEFHIPTDFPADVLAAADRAARSWNRDDRADATDVELVTLDPPGSRDLDQAFALRRADDGYRFHYAIADVAAYVEPTGPIATEAKVRGETLYLPDGRAPLYPASLSEGAASLLPDGNRPAVLWQLDLDENGEPTAVAVRRAMVRSRAQLDYATIEKTRPETARLLAEVGGLRQQRERERGGVSLNVPEQEVAFDNGHWTLSYRSPLPSEGWNAQLSLLVGMAAARLMIEAKVGLLRTMPEPSRSTVASLRRTADALGITWASDASYADVVRALDPSVPAHAALLRLASSLFRGARYAAFDGSLSDETTHSAVAAPYAHATAPLRRLADRFVSEICLSVSAGRAIPQWARDGLAGLPDVMAAADQHAHQVDRAVVDLAETVLLQKRIGDVFSGVVVEAQEDRGEVQLIDPPVRARLEGDRLPLGQQVEVRLATAQVATRRTEFVLA